MRDFVLETNLLPPVRIGFVICACVRSVCACVCVCVCAVCVCVCVCLCVRAHSVCVRAQCVCVCVCVSILTLNFEPRLNSAIVYQQKTLEKFISSVRIKGAKNGLKMRYLVVVRGSKVVGEAAVEESQAPRADQKP